MKMDKLSTEWQILQRQSEQYEQYSLLIKLLSIFLLFISIVITAPLATIIVFVLLWLQDAIWKTFQSRTEQRLVALEQIFQQVDATDEIPFQLHYPFSVKPRSLVSMISAYLTQALRPTIAMVHGLIVLSFNALYFLS